MCKNGNHSNKLENEQLATKQFEKQSERTLAKLIKESIWIFFLICQFQTARKKPDE